MPIVFVHGVNTRKGPVYDNAERIRTDFIKGIILPELGRDPAAITFRNVYWGDDGVKFRWNQASLPDPEKQEEAFGAADPRDAELVEQLPDLAAWAGKASIIEVAKVSMPEAVDLLWGATALNIQDPDERAELAKAYLDSIRYAETHPHPEWLDNAKPGNFGDQLVSAIKKERPAGDEAFGASFTQKLSETAKRLSNVFGNTTGDAAVALGRRKAHLAASVFVGDVFEYLMTRGTKEAPGKIPANVTSVLREARAHVTQADPELIVLAHSLGGVISYDVLTYFAPDIEVDKFVSIGSQVGLFEEMGMYMWNKANRDQTPTGKLKPPQKLKKWINVFDTTDMFAFRVGAVFDGASDFSYNTGYGIAGAHSGYFARPSFYARLAERLK
ncbi:MAG TPA: hypothetical protein VN929_03400 [Burkholderiales bacterium]|nr:hypothetical protein [Burkholderiales bacterium]